MICSSCGSAVEAGAGFCHLCGAPVRVSPESTGEPLSGEPLRFSLEASALGIFGRALLLGLSMPFVVPIPWTLSWFNGWLAGEVEANNGERFKFSGNASNVWKLVALYVLSYAIVIGSGFAEDEQNPQLWPALVNIVTQLAMMALSWAFIRWFIDHVEFSNRAWRFDGSVWGFLGWNLLFAISILTIIGWAWALAGMYSWIADHVQNAGGKLRFLGAGHEMLWRTIVMIIGCLFIIPIPWAIKWFYGWVVSQLELTPDGSASAVL